MLCGACRRVCCRSPGLRLQHGGGQLVFELAEYVIAHHVFDVLVLLAVAVGDHVEADNARILVGAFGHWHRQAVSIRRPILH